MNSPAGQGEQIDGPSLSAFLLKNPAEQEKHEVRPVELAKKPSSQAVHTANPDSGFELPRPHAEQKDCPENS